MYNKCFAIDENSTILGIILHLHYTSTLSILIPRIFPNSPTKRCSKTSRLIVKWRHVITVVIIVVFFFVVPFPAPSSSSSSSSCFCPRCHLPNAYRHLQCRSTIYINAKAKKLESAAISVVDLCSTFIFSLLWRTDADKLY